MFQLISHYYYHHPFIAYAIGFVLVLPTPSLVVMILPVLYYNTIHGESMSSTFIIHLFIH